MRKTKNTIKINGKTYDAITGELLGGSKTALHSKSVVEQPVTAGSVINPQTTVTPSKTTTIAKQAPTKKTVVRHKAKSAKRTPQTSRTLMRTSVRKPSHAANSHDKTHIKSTSKLAHNTTVVAVKKSARHVDARRLEKARQTPKSHKIVKFGKAPHVSKTIQHHASQPKVTAHPIQHHVTTTHHKRKKHQSAHRQKTSADILQEALHHATSHRQPAPKRHMSRSQRVAGFSALVVVSGALLGIVALQSAPTIKMRIASAKAGFSASLPGYSPAGFHLGELQYGAGAVAMKYDSNSDATRKFSITQKTSAWDSTTLRDTFVAKNDSNFTVAEEAGLTIYLYGQNNATWVDQGVWFQVQGNGSLSNRQLVDIAKSL